MTRVYIRHVGAFVALGAVLIPHWLPGRHPTGQGPLHYAAGLLLAVVLLVGWAMSKNRAEARGDNGSA